MNDKKKPTKVKTKTPHKKFSVDREMETIKRQADTIQEQQALLDYLREQQPRTIIGISGCGVHNANTMQCDSILYALCNDGSVWEMRSGFAVWGQVPPIPQD